MTRPAEIVVSVSEWESQWSLCRDHMKRWLAKPKTDFGDEELMRQFERLKGNLEGDKPRYNYYA